MSKKIEAKHMFSRLSPKKAAIVMDLVRGKPLEDAKVALAFDNTKAARLILKVLKSAEANAKNNEGLDPKDLRVSEIYVSPGPMYKRAKMGAKGRIDPILKRTSHLYVALSSEIDKKLNLDSKAKNSITEEKAVKKLPKGDKK